MDLSVIIPVYNTDPKDLRRCFDSVRSFKGITHEVLIIDDGSRKETARFCMEYAQVHPFFRYVHQENQGVSAARNEGLRQAAGRYVLFADADDEVIPDAVHKEYLDQGDEIIVFDFELIEGKRRVKWKMFHRDAGGKLEKKEIFAAACRNLLNSSCSKLFLRSYLEAHNISFDQTMVFAEDARFVFQTVMAAQKCRYIGRVLYRYYHSFGNGDRRLLRCPERVVGNSIQLYEERRAALGRPEIGEMYTPKELHSLKVDVSGWAVQDLFEASGSLRIRGRLDKQINRLIFSTAVRLHEEYGGEFTGKVRIKSMLLSRDCGLAIRMIAYLREIHIRIRR